MEERDRHRLEQDRMVCHAAQAQRTPVYGKARGPSTHLRDGNTLVLQLLAAGEFPVAAGVYEYSVEDLKTKGAPVDWIGLEPVITYTVAVSLPLNRPAPLRLNSLSNGCCQRKARRSLTSTGVYRFATTLNRATARFSSNTNCS